jgi:hypothetical protein
MGKSPNTVRRWLGVLNDTVKTCPNGQVSGLLQAEHKLLLAIRHYRRVASESSAETNQSLLTCLETVESLLRGDF